MTTACEANPEPTHSSPPRFWWLKRIVVVVLVIALGLAALRMWWGWEAERRWSRTLDELRGRGEPVVMADFQPIDIPDAENAAHYLKQAAAAVTFNSPSSTNMSYRGYPPFPKRWHRVADQAVAQNAKALQLARQARACERADWNLTLNTPVMSTLLPFLGATRNLANLVGDAALQAHVNGDDFEAVERLRDLMAQARAVRQPPFLISHLTALGIEALAHQRIHMIAAGMRIDPAPGATGGGAGTAAPTTAAHRPATRAQVRALIESLLSDDRGAAARGALQSERMMMIDTIDWTTSGNPVLAPMFALERVRTVDALAPSIRAANQPTLPRAQAVLSSAPGTTRSRRGDMRLASLLTSSLTPALNRAIQVDFIARNERHLAAAALAVQLYRGDHGRWPESLEQLVPEYLPQVPSDRYTPDGAPLRFAIIAGGWPDGSDRAVIYSVGEDGRDDTRDAGARPPAEPQFGHSRTPDQWRDLEIPPAAATQPADDEPDVDDDQDEAESGISATSPASG